MCFLFVLYHSKQRVSPPEPISQPAEFQILYTARRSDELNILDALSKCEAIYLINPRDPVISKELLDIRIEATTLKKSITKQHHAVLPIRAKQTFVH